ncbi:hypothetical protein CHUAL_006932 [Chamberlinius hualienensis]
MTNSQLHGNPWKCDCVQIPFIIWLKQKRQKEIMKSGSTASPFNELTCKQPIQLFDKELIDLDLNQLKCHNSTVVAENCAQQQPNSTKCQWLREKVCDDQSQKISNCLCNVAAQHCYFCPEGYYAKNDARSNALQCQSCPSLTSSEFGATHISQCQCIPGYEKYTKDDEQDHLCFECPFDTYKYKLGWQSCEECDNASTNGTEFEAATHCICLQNFTMDNTTGQCLPTLNTQIENEPKTRHVDNFDSHFAIKYDSLLMIIGISVCVAVLGIAALRYMFKNKQKKKKKIKDMKVTMNQLLSSVNFPQSYENSYINSDNINTFMIEIHRIKFEEILGQGAFGQVHKAIVDCMHNKSTQTTVAIKSVRENCSQEEKDALNSEFQQLIYVGYHPNIINLLGFTCVDDSVMLIMEYAPQGDLLSYLKNKIMDTQYASLQFDITGTEMTSIATTSTTPNYQSALASSSSSATPGNDRNKIDAKTLLVIVWQVAKGMQHLALMKVFNSRTFKLCTTHLYIYTYTLRHFYTLYS